MRDFIKIGDAAQMFGVAEQTLRNWDRAGKLKAYRHPVNGYRLYKIGDLHRLLQTFSESLAEVASNENPQLSLALPPSSGRRTASAARRDRLEECHWSLGVALDPKHRPQYWNLPSSTVRRDWRKYPQEAHVVDAANSRYRRLTPDEMADLQSIDRSVFKGLELTDRQRIACIGDAVPPLLAKAAFSGIVECVKLRSPTSLEVCAGIGGLASGAYAAGLEHLALIEKSEICVQVLRNHRPWKAQAVHASDVKSFDFGKYRDKVGVFSGGPPCQPWSRSGFRLGSSDARDLLGYLPEVIADLRPEVFLFENVPGLTGTENSDYLHWLIERFRRPVRKLRYAVLIGRFNAADFGVPQVRHRIFVLGIKNAKAQDVSRCLDKIAEKRTHRDPTISDPTRLPWRTVGNVLETGSDAMGWRRWIASPASEAA